MKGKFLHAIFHWCMHFLFILVPLYILNSDFSVIFIALLAGIFIDLDHLLIAPIKKWRIHLDFDISRTVPLHNYLFFTISFLLSFLFVLNNFIGAIFLGFFLHLLWDLVQDAIFFRHKLHRWRTLK